MWGKLDMHIFKKWEIWTDNRKDTIKIDQVHGKENPMELLEIKKYNSYNN